GRAAVAEFLRARHRQRTPRRWRFLPAAANGQPSYGFYLPDGGGWRCAGMFVVGVRVDGIESITRFRAAGGLTARFGLPERL
ncbi:MAG: RNA polymerase subunit sigma-70, partial [Solirubrobacteraceae bacterium]